MIRFPLHPASMIFPEMSKQDYEALVNSIREHGQLDPVWIYEGKIIDGRHRQMACKELNIDVIFREWNGEGSLVDFVIGLNLGRRHMSAQEKAVAAFKALPMYEAEAAERKRLNGIANAENLNNQDVSREVPRLEPPVEKFKSIEQAAAAFGVGKQYIADVKKISKESPDVFKKIESGKLTIPEAKREVQERKQETRIKENSPPPEVVTVCTITVPFSGRMKLSNLIAVLQEAFERHGDVVTITRSGSGQIIEISEREV